jgi:hypothetical protein
VAKANHRIRVFKLVSELEKFIRTDGTITSIVSLGTDDNGTFVLVYDIT